MKWILPIHYPLCAPTTGVLLGNAEHRAKNGTSHMGLPAASRNGTSHMGLSAASRGIADQIQQMELRVTFCGKENEAEQERNVDGKMKTIANLKKKDFLGTSFITIFSITW